MEKSAKELQGIAKKVRQDILKMVYQAGSGHLGGSFSSTDFLVAFYFGGILKYDSAKPDWEDRDRFILSAGHYCPVLYSVLSRLGYFDRKLLWTLRELGSPLQGHPHRESLQGIELSTGALGQGLSVGAGMALALKLKKYHLPFVFVLMSDGEQNEGQVWEAVMTASKYKLDNLIAIVDKNGIQSTGDTLDVMPLENLKRKYEAFGWEVAIVDGHDMEEIIKILKQVQDDNQNGKSKVVIAKTVAGKGVSFLENDFRWHAKPIGEGEYKKAMAELD